MRPLSRPVWPRTMRVAIVLGMMVTLIIPTAAAADENQLPIGTHDGFPEPVADEAGECYANGWAVDPDDTSARLPLRISLDGTVVTTLSADEFRQDLLDAGISDGFSGFWYDLRGHVTLGEAVEVFVEAQDAQTGDWQPMDATPRTLTCLSAPPIGFHDTSEGEVPSYDCVAAGWSVDVDSPTTRVLVRVLVDGVEVASGTADGFREDLIEAGIPGDGFSGFGFDLWPLIQPLAWHEVRTQAQDLETGAWSDLEATPRQLRCVNAPTANPFHGVWTAMDFDASLQTLIISAGPAGLRVTYRDDYATICAKPGAANTRFQGTGTGRLVAPDRLEVTLTNQHCGQTAFLVLAHDPESDQLFSDFGVWTRQTP